MKVMHAQRTLKTLVAAAIVVGCGDDGGTGASASQASTSAAPSTDAPTTTPTPTGGQDTGAASSTSDGSGTIGVSATGTTGVVGVTTGTGDAASSSSGAQVGTSTGEPGSTTIEGTTAAETTVGVPCEPMGGGDIKFSYLWVANSGQNTVSKINTLTLVEEGRYAVQPPGIPGGSPSRTSVNLHGDVAVANRCNLAEPVPDGCAGVTKIAAQPEDCLDADGDGKITTSTGANDIKAWGKDECVLWHTPFKARSNRPVAWTAGELNPDTCVYDDPMLWTATSNDGDDTSVKVYLLDGADGSIEQEIKVTGWEGSGYAIYGGAVDSKDDFWFVGGYANLLGHVRISDFTFEVIPASGTPYGTMVDNKDRPWLLNGQLNRYDPVAKTWATAPCNFACTSITQDGDGNVWIGGVPLQDNPIRLLKIDPDTLAVLDTITGADIPEIGLSWGLATDVEGYLWAVENGNKAFKIDRKDYSYQIFTNPTSMYTYSDMTGFGLINVLPQ